MWYKTILCVLVGVVFLSNPLQGAYISPPKPQNRPISVIIADNAKKYGVEIKTLEKVIKCESGFNPKAVGDNGKSHGLVQIHLPSHPYVTKAQAQDPEFAVKFLARNFSKGNGRMWTCARILGLA